jgi:hypothetical protein
MKTPVSDPALDCLRMEAERKELRSRNDPVLLRN